MYDPHTRDSRGFGFVTMETGEEADAAITALNSTELMGKVMNVEKVRCIHLFPPQPLLTSSSSSQARRGRARTPTPGRYYGPPKRNDCPFILFFPVSFYIPPSNHFQHLQLNGLMIPARMIVATRATMMTVGEVEEVAAVADTTTIVVVEGTMTGVIVGVGATEITTEVIAVEGTVVVVVIMTVVGVGDTMTGGIELWTLFSSRF